MKCNQKPLDTMKKNNALFWGIIITVFIAILSTWVSRLINIKTEFIPNSLVTHSIMLILSVSAVFWLKKYVNYHISIPNLRSTIKPVIFGFLVSLIGTMITMSIIMSNKEINGTELSMPTSKMSVLQIFIFVFLYASLAEEMLYRGFLQNFLEPLKEKGIRVLNRKISVPVIISAVLFGISHLVLLKPGENIYFVFGIIITSIFIGIIAGYYQEKNNNNFYAIITHMSANVVGLIGAFMMNLNS
mgnify:CR=1 FL=1